MKKNQTGLSEKAGKPPGTLQHIGDKKSEEVKITLINYDQSNLEEKQLKDVEGCFSLKEKSTVSWINIDGLHNTDIIKKLGENFQLHPLVLEDILNIQQRPKMEDFEDYLFIVLKMLEYDKDKMETSAEQVSLVIGINFVISFQETTEDTFNNIRNRIRTGKGRIRKAGPDYLAYALIDAIVDNYFKILENYGGRIESLEEEVVENPTTQTLQNIHDLKRELIFLRKSVWPLREVISNFSKEDSSLINEKSQFYIRDVYDHTIQVIDTIETYRDMVSSMFEIYLSTVSNRMNEIMKVLTVIATIFIPLTFIAGIYGMNFVSMPELEWSYAYPIVLISMLTIGIAMILFFRKKEWL